MEEGLLLQEGKAKPFPVCAMFGLLAFGFAYGELISNFGLIMLPAEAGYMEPANNAIMMTFLLFVSGISQFSGPLAGYYSDRCQSSWGRRRPYLLAGTVFTIPALLCMWIGHGMFHPHDDDGSMGSMGSGDGDGSLSADDSSSLFGGKTGKHMWGEVLYILAFLVAMAAFNVQNQTLGSLISDMVPSDQTGQANGVMAVLMLLGSLIGFLVFRTLDGGFGRTTDLDGKEGALHFLPVDIPVQDAIGSMYYYYIPVIAITTFVTIAAAKETRNPITKDRLPPVMCDDIWKCFFVSPTLHKDFFIVTMSRTMYYCGISTMAFLQYFFRDLVICGPPYDKDCVADAHGNGRIQDFMAKTALIAVYAQAGSAISAYPSGLASDAWGRKPLVYMACLGMGAIYLFMPFFSGETLVMTLGFVWGVCNGCFVAVDFAIAIDTLPDKQEAAKFLGVWGVSAFVGTTVGPITGGLALYFFGQMEDGLGGGGPVGAGESLLTYRYSKYGYIAVMAFGAVWNVLSCIIINYVDFDRAAALQKKNAEARRSGVQ
eukprot:COSAG02_NODE_67_length_42609_cov_14.506681_10_plen_542_part_00